MIQSKLTEELNLLHTNRLSLAHTLNQINQFLELVTTSNVTKLDHIYDPTIQRGLNLDINWKVYPTSLHIKLRI